MAKSHENKASAEDHARMLQKRDYILLIPWLPADNGNDCRPEIALRSVSISHDGESGPARSELARNCESKSDCDVLVVFVDFTYLVAVTGLMTSASSIGFLYRFC